MRFAAPAIALCLSLCAPAAHAASRSVYLQELSSTEVRDALRDGTRTIIIPVGGTEQNGAHMALGKHNFRAQALAGRIAAELGHTLVAPVVAYVPEGRVAPPTEHMRWAGTISVPDEAFRAVLDGAARSLAQHGFKDIVFIGDHGGYQAQLKAVVDRLNRDWARSGARAHYVAEYYRASQDGVAALLRARGLSAAQIGTHAGSADTAVQLAVAPNTVRSGLLAQAAREGAAGGVAGDPQAASAALGQEAADLIVTQSTAAIRAALGAARR